MRKSQLLILGNGFDLHCGLKSSYKDFFRSEILDTYSEKCGYPVMRNSCKGFWEGLLFGYYKETPHQDYNWCDIESIIKDTLWKLFIKSDFSDSGLWIYALNAVRTKRDLDDLQLNYNLIEKYILWNCICFINSTKTKDMYGYEFSHSFVQSIYHELHNFERRFCKYLKNQIVNPNNEDERNEEYIVKAVNLFLKLTGFPNYEFNKVDDIVPIQGEKGLAEVFNCLNKVFILNFNYTALFDILDVEIPFYYNNVHGKLCNDRCSKDICSSNIIFGIDDNLIQSQGASSELRLFSKTYRKMLNCDKNIIALPPIAGKPIEIKFYGHSLSEADYSYFQSIFDYYSIYGNNTVNLTFYYSKGFENHDAVYKLISAYGKSLTNKEQGKNLIHKLLLENRLHIQEIKD